MALDTLLSLVMDSTDRPVTHINTGMTLTTPVVQTPSLSMHAVLTKEQAISFLQARMKPLIDSITKADENGDDTSYYFPIHKSRFVNIDGQQQLLKLNRSGAEKIVFPSFQSHLGVTIAEWEALVKLIGKKNWKKHGNLGCHYYTNDYCRMEWVMLSTKPFGANPKVTPKQQCSQLAQLPFWLERPVLVVDSVVVGRWGDQDAVQKQNANANRSKRQEVEKKKKEEDTDKRNKAEAEKKRSRKGCLNSLVDHTIGTRTFPLPCNVIPIRKLLFDELMTKASVSKRTEKELVSVKAERDEDRASRAKMAEQIANDATATKIGQRILDRAMNAKICASTPLANQYYARAWAQCPKISAEALSMMAPLVIAAFLSDMNVDDLIGLENIPKSTPSPKLIRKIVRVSKQAVLIRIAKELEEGNVPFCMSHDKGERSGIGRLIKEISFYDFNEGCVVSIRFDADGANSDDKAVAEAIDMALNNLDEHTSDGAVILQMCGMTTDTGGGGTTESCAEKLRAIGRIYFICHIANCMMHAHSKCLENAWTAAFGVGALGSKTMLQWLHTCYSVQKACGDSFETMWEKYNGKSDTLTQLIRPVLTRWGYCTKAAEAVLNEWEGWMNFLDGVYEDYNNSEATMARYTLQLALNPKLKCELEFIVAFSRSFWNKHFAWLHRIDEKTKLSCHSSHEAPFRVAVMKRDLLYIKNNWRTMPKYDAFRTSFDNLPSDVVDSEGKATDSGKETMFKQMNIFFDSYETTFDEHFDRWSNSLGHFSVASSNPKVSSMYAKWFLGYDLLDTAVVGDDVDLCDGCHIHRTTCMSSELASFLQLQTCSRENVLFSQYNSAAIRLIANGANLYTDEREPIKSFLQDVKRFIFPLKHNTQSTESGVQDISICCANQKSEDDSGALTLLRSADNGRLNQKMREAHKGKVKQGNQHTSKGKTGERQLRSARSMKNEDARVLSEAEVRYHSHVTKERMMTHIIDVKINAATEAQWKRAKEVQKRKSAPLGRNAAKKMRVNQKEEQCQQRVAKRLASNRSNFKNASSLEKVAMDTPIRFEDMIEIKKFRKKSTRPYLERELIIRGVESQNLEGKTQTDIRRLLCLVELTKRKVMPREGVHDGKNQAYIDGLLNETPLKTKIKLLDPTNQIGIDELYRLTKR